MKSIILLVVCVVHGLASMTTERQAELKKFSEECSNEIGISTEELQRALMGWADEVADKVKCFAECLLKKENIMDDNSNISEKVLEEKLPKDMPKAKVDRVKECVIVDGDTGCDKAAAFLQCVIRSIAIYELV